MKIISGLVQGSSEWHDHRANHVNASDAPVMMGVSKYKTRDQLLSERHSGVSQSVDNATQKRFNDGHRYESLARPIAEGIIGDTLSPVTGVSGGYSASFDGITFDGSVIFEHKSLNDELRKAEFDEDGYHLPEMYRIQMEHQLYVSGAEKCLFMASVFDGSDNLVEERHGWYMPDPVLRKRIIAGWIQFQKDLMEYVPPVVVAESVAAPVKDLPAVVYEMDGMSLTSNIEAVVKPAVLAQIAMYEKKPETDQDFADLNAFTKNARESVKKSALLRETVMAKIVDVDKFNRDLIEIEDLLTKAAISGEKIHKAETENRKNAIRATGPARFAEHIASLQAEIKGVRLVVEQPDFIAAGKGLSKLDSLKSAIDTCLRNAIIDADATAKDWREKLVWCKDNAEGKSHLFPDLQSLMPKPYEDFCNTIKLRISEADEKEKARIAEIEAQAKIDAEAKLKAEVEVKPEPVIAKPESPAKVVVEHQDEISTFLSGRKFKDESRIRAILVEFVKFQSKENK